MHPIFFFQKSKMFPTEEFHIGAMRIGKFNRTQVIGACRIFFDMPSERFTILPSEPDMLKCCPMCSDKADKFLRKKGLAPPSFKKVSTVKQKHHAADDEYFSQDTNHGKSTPGNLPFS